MEQITNQEGCDDQIEGGFTLNDDLGSNESPRDAGFSEIGSDGVNYIAEDYEIEAQLALEQAESLKRRDLDGPMARGLDDILADTELKQLQDYAVPAVQNRTEQDPRLPDEYESSRDPRIPDEYKPLSEQDLHDGINNGAISLKPDNESRQDEPIVPQAEKSLDPIDKPDAIPTENSESDRMDVDKGGESNTPNGDALDKSCMDVDMDGALNDNAGEQGKETFHHFSGHYTFSAPLQKADVFIWFRGPTPKALSDGATAPLTDINQFREQQNPTDVRYLVVGVVPRGSKATLNKPSKKAGPGIYLEEEKFPAIFPCTPQKHNWFYVLVVGAGGEPDLRKVPIDRIFLREGYSINCPLEDGATRPTTRVAIKTLWITVVVATATGQIRRKEQKAVAALVQNPNCNAPVPPAPRGGF